jgi:hypothetical protein
MTTEQLIEKLRKSGLEEVDACWGEADTRTHRSTTFKINNNKFIHIQESPVVEFEAQESSRSYYPVVFWHFFPKQKKDKTFWERIKIYDTCTTDEFEEHFTRFLNA